MTEYIDKVSFLQQERENYCKGCDSRNGLVCRVCEMNNVLNDIEDYQTADVVEVVRCKDCKYYQNGEILTDIKFCFHQRDICDKRIAYCRSDDDFCSYGERRGDDVKGNA